jgi:hypothetical protein
MYNGIRSMSIEIPGEFWVLEFVELISWKRDICVF